ncbi:hypothetical protein JP74_16650 [Devosia sp. 17-2-E-8]|nr:hypothetical protein JP74_16650 [Devosia sp. 17-2-E-8]
MPFVNLPLPSRALAVSPRPYAPPRGMLVSLLVMAALAVALILWQGPGLWRDVQINQHPVTLRMGDVRDGECTTRRGITDCKARLVYSYNGVDYDTYTEMAFVDFSSKDYDVQVVISGDKPELATLSLGLEMLWNRLAVFAVFVLIFIGGILAMLFQTFRSMQGNAALRTPARITELVPVAITAHHGQHFSYRGVGPAKQDKKTAQAVLDKGQEPLMAVDDKGEVRGVAARFENVALPVLLDANLERLDLTDAERITALDAFHAEQAGRGTALPKDAGKAKRSLRFWRGLGIVLVVIVLAIAAAFAYWVYYVTSTQDRYDSLGMELNNMMPEPLNVWGCKQLEARFGDEPAPFGCTASDFQSWK